MIHAAHGVLPLDRDLPLSQADFQRIVHLAHVEAGLSVPDTKEPLVYSRLAKRLRQLSLDSFTAYVDLLYQPDAGEERAMFVSSLTTNTTRFFREEHHFEFLAARVLPEILPGARRGARVRIWSAGCSSGEESYSVAITILRHCPQAASYDIKILATDIDHQILAAAEAGRFSRAALAGLPENLRDDYFGPPDSQGTREVAPCLRELVTFRPMNLVAPWPVAGPFDVIYCRNVAIYFNAATQEGIWRGFARTLAPNGYLFIGHSERLSPSVRHQFETVGMTSYRLRGPQHLGEQGKGET